MVYIRRTQPAVLVLGTVLGVVVVGAGCLLLGWRTSRSHTNTNESPPLSAPKLLPLPFQTIQHQPLPMWGQNQPQEVVLGGVSGIPVLMLVTTEDLSLVRRSIESVLEEIGGSDLHLVVSVSSPSPALLDLLYHYPITTHTSTSHATKHHFIGHGRFKSFLNKFIPAVSRFTSFLNMFSDGSVCVRDEINPEIAILNTRASTSETSTYRFTLADLQKQERGMPFMENPYNPVLRKALANTRQEEQAARASDTSDGSKVNAKGEEETSGVCQKCCELKEALQFVKESFPHLQYLVLLETGYALSPDFVSYLNQMVPTLRVDPSIYCISAHNPLALPRPSPTPRLPAVDLDRVYRYDHFIATASLIPVKVVDEVIGEFVIYQETAALQDQKSALSWLETWLSWWSRKRRRGCVVPAVSRVCPIPRTTRADEGGRAEREGEGPAATTCSHSTHTLFNTSRLLHFQYSQDLFEAVEAAEPLGTREIDCSKPDFFPENMNASVYIIYVKMENYDDDFTFHHIMECLGLDLAAVVGYFEGVFQVTYRNTRILLLGIPYSPFSPSIKNLEALLVADIPDMSIRGQTSYQKFKDTQFKFNTVLIRQKIL